MSVEPPSAEDFFHWEDEMTEGNKTPEGPGIVTKIVGGVIVAMIVVFVLILLGKAIIWAVHL